MYLKSSIILQKESGLYKASIVSSWFYFGQQEDHESFRTLGEARDWLIEKRCENLEQPETKKTTKISYADKLKCIPKV